MANVGDIVELDPDTREWFKGRIGIQTTVVRCPKCGLFYKASLGHKTRNCKKPLPVMFEVIRNYGKEIRHE